MSSVRTIFVFLAFLSVTEADAQNQKIGFVDSDAIVEQMPEYAGIEQRLSLLSQSWRDELRDMDSRIDDLDEEFNAREILYTDETREQKIIEITALEEERDRYLQEKFGPDGEYFQRQRELLESVQRQVFEAVTRVAERDGFDFVFDRSGDIRFLFAGSEWNLTEDIMTELGLAVR